MGKLWGKVSGDNESLNHMQECHAYAVYYSSTSFVIAVVIWDQEITKTSI